MSIGQGEIYKHKCMVTRQAKIQDFLLGPTAGGGGGGDIVTSTPLDIDRVTSYHPTPRVGNT